MKKSAIAAISLIALTYGLPAGADEEDLVRFKGGIAVIPVSSGQGTAATATVCEPEHSPRSPTRRPALEDPRSQG
jgi:hypothetical protein